MAATLLDQPDAATDIDIDPQAAREMIRSILYGGTDEWVRQSLLQTLISEQLWNTVEGDDQAAVDIARRVRCLLAAREAARQACEEYNLIHRRAKVLGLPLRPLAA